MKNWMFVAAAILWAGMLYAETAVGEEPIAKRVDVGFDQGTKILSAGTMDGGSPLGVDFEYGLSYLFGLQAGIGLGGFDAGANLHVTSDMNKDIYFSVIAICLPTFEGLIMPSLSFGARFYLSQDKRIGISGELGSAYSFRDVSMDLMGKNLPIQKGQAIPKISIAAVFKVK
jgi:hypothetical protein